MEMTQISIDLAWPSVFPDEGFLSASSTSAYAESSFSIDEPRDQPRLSVLPTEWENDGDIFAIWSCPNYSVGDEVIIFGTGFDVSSTFPLGVYINKSRDRSGEKLVLSEIVNTDEDGNFTLSIQTEESDVGSWFHVLVVVEDLSENPWCSKEEHDVSYEACPIGPLACFQVSLPSLRAIPPEFQPYMQTLVGTDIPLMLPPEFPSESGLPPIYPYLFVVSYRLFELDLGYGIDCQGAGVCHYGSMSGKGVHEDTITGTSSFPFDSNKARPVVLAKGITGYFTEAVCEANCSDATVNWIYNNYQYMVGLKAGSEADVVALANAAILNSVP